MSHYLWHKQLPEYGSPGFGSAVSDRLRQQTLPRPQGLLAPNEIDVSQYIMDQGPPPPPISAPMESGVSPRQSGFTGSIEWDVMDGNLEDPLGGPDMGQDPSNVGDVVGAGLSGAGQYVSNIFKPPGLDKWVNLQSNNLGFPDRRKRRQTWMSA
jgi:hypothetical protein